jgi:hypothetical protein
MSRGRVFACAVAALCPIGAAAAQSSSRSLGVPWDGRLVGGVALSAQSERHFTWDPVRRRSPNREWRRYGNARLVRTTMRVLRAFAAANPDAPRIGVGDLSRRHGGDFGARFGGIGHASHQNGLDVDVYYPRRDRRERPPRAPRQIDRALAQGLLDRFVAAGAAKVFIGPNTGLRGPPATVEVLPAYHDNHMHVRLPGDGVRSAMVGTSTRGLPVRAFTIGSGRPRTLVVGCIHGNECAGTAVTRILARSSPGVDLWVVSQFNPDGFALGRRQNARGVDLNRNFPSEWRAGGRPWDGEYPGPRPLSEPETRAAVRLIRRIEPTLTIWFHQPQTLVRAWGQSRPAARRYARLAGTRFRAIRWPPGTAPNWQNHFFPGTSSFVVELAPGPLTSEAANRHARAVLALLEPTS